MLGVDMGLLIKCRVGAMKAFKRYWPFALNISGAILFTLYLILLYLLVEYPGGILAPYLIG